MITRIINKSNNFNVIGLSSTYSTLIQLCGKHKPAIILTESKLQNSSGVKVAGEIYALLPGMRIIGNLSVKKENNYLEMIQAGAEGLIYSSSLKVELVAALTAVFNNHLYLCSEMLKRIYNEAMATSDQKAFKFSLAPQKILFNQFTKRDI